MEKVIRENEKAWQMTYETSSFGNKYPSSYLVSLFHRVIKKNLPVKNKIKVLDFGCSLGANAKFISDMQGYEVYGIDVSPDAITYCIEEVGFSKDHFCCCNVLKDNISLKELFGEIDLIIASEVLYYFAKSDLDILLAKFKECLCDGGIIYADMPTLNHGAYREYAQKIPNEEGMIEVKSTGSVEQTLWVRLVKDKDDMRNIFHEFDEIATLRTLEEIEGENEEIHFVGRKHK